MTTRLFTQKERNVFEQICKLKQPGVMSFMRQFLTQKYGVKNVEVHRAYLLAKGNIPVGVVAHADTVFKAPPKEFYYDTQKNVFWSPDGLGADDRAGIFMITRLVNAGYRPHVIITTDEECGCLGAYKLIGKHTPFPYDLKFLIQLDRRGDKDSVYYDCENPEFETFINQFGFETAWGSLSDISILAPAWGVAAVNFSVGYRDEHSYQERLFVNSMFNTLDKVRNILEYVMNHEDCPTFEYIEAVYSYGYGYGSFRGETAGAYSETWWDDGYNLHSTKKNDALHIIGGTDEGVGICCFCGDHDRIENYLHLWYDENTSMYMCNECYSSRYEDVEWCAECKTGWFLTKDELAKIKNNDGDRSKWLCRTCRKAKNDDDRDTSAGRSGNSDAGKQSAKALPTRRNGTAHRPTHGKVAISENRNDTLHEWAGL